MLPWWAYWIPLLAAVVGAGAGVGGVAIGQWLQRKAVTRQWQRDRKLDAYSQYLGRTVEVAEALSLAINSGNAEEQDAAREAFRSRVVELDAAQARVRLLGTKTVDAAARALMDYVMETLYPLTGHGDPPEPDVWEPAFDGFRDRGEAFLVATRDDLGIEDG